MIRIKPIIKTTRILFYYLIIIIVFAVISAIVSNEHINNMPNIIMFFVIMRKMHKSNTLKFNNFKSTYIIVIILFSIINFITYNKISYLINGFKISSYPSNITVFSIIYLIIYVTVEEVIFRKIFFGELNTFFKPQISIVIQGVVFGVLHFNSLGHIVASILFGISVGIIYNSTKSLYYCIILHVFYNLYFDIITIKYTYYEIFDKFVYQNNTIFYIALILQISILILFIQTRQKDS